MRTTLLTSLVFATFLQIQYAAAADIDFTRPMPLGKLGLEQTFKVKSLANGVTHIEMRRGQANLDAHWQLMSNVVQTDETHKQTITCFEKLGIKANSTQFRIAGAIDRPYQIITGGIFKTRQEADALAKRASCKLSARHNSEDINNENGPWEIQLVVIDPAKSNLSLHAISSQTYGAFRQTTSKLAQSKNALVAINGGFFVESPEDGFPGQAAGVSMVDGQVISGPVLRRPTVVVSPNKEQKLNILPELNWKPVIEWDDGNQTVITGFNRKLGIVRNCGLGDQPVHDHTCRYVNDLVYFPPKSPFIKLVKNVESFALNNDGEVRQLKTNETAKQDEALILAQGAALVDLKKRLKQSKGKFKLHTDLFQQFGNQVSLVNGGPTLLRAGQMVRNDANEGWSLDANANVDHQRLMHDWINRRNPRTAIGVTAKGHIIMLVADGHRHHQAVGLTIEELRTVMHYLGAADAINLDGGGSSAMVVRGKLVNHPTDRTGERKIGDALILTKS